MKSFRLLSRPCWIPGESWTGYLLRLSDANALDGVMYLAEMLGLSYRSLSTAYPSAVLTALGVEAHGTPRIRYPKLNAHPTKQNALGFPSRISGRPRKVPVCPLCLAQDKIPYIRACWECPLELGCGIHRTELLMRCCHCGAEVDSMRHRLLECECGASLLVQPVRHLGDSWQAMPRIFGARRREPSDATFRPIDPKEILAASVVQRLARYETGAAETLIRKPNVHDHLDVTDYLKAQTWFENWPVNFEQKYMVARFERRADAEGELGKRGAYISAETVLSTQFPRIQAAIWRVARQRFSQRNRKSRARPETDILRAEQTLLSTARILGITLSTVMHLATWGHLEGARKLGPRRYRIPTHGVLAVQKSLASMKHFSDVSSEFGMPPFVWAVLVCIGLLPGLIASSSGLMGWVCTTSSQDLYESLLARAVKTTRRAFRPMPFAETIKCYFHRYTWLDVAMVLRGILTGEVPLYYRRSGSSLDDLFLDGGQTRAYLRRSRNA